MEQKNISISSFKYGNHPHYDYESTLLELTSRYLVVKSIPGREIYSHSKKTTYIINNWAVEFFPFEHWFTVAVDLRGGEVESYYCNIAQPPSLKGEILSYIDLDIDFIRDKNGVWKIVDEDEFEENLIKYSYPNDLIERVKAETKAFHERIDMKGWPFDGSTLEKYIELVKQESLSDNLEIETVIVK